MGIPRQREACRPQGLLGIASWLALAAGTSAALSSAGDSGEGARPGSPCLLFTTPAMWLQLSTNRHGSADVVASVPDAAFGACSFQFFALDGTTLLATQGLSLFLHSERLGS
jgi:hypothetical protein